ncbi:hypothetical protein SLEP1_g8859 [Rubroshorea leprosula]|uniref:Exostosin GT47 domain-containing protein n=1 Tax=Rubroshorea leprosula TaxID=152421 RepID=A0AAV5ICB5_9ROSI|nr:hypothetical protein SLEP1_g8859 [Rubroshorea leprosula]
MAFRTQIEAFSVTIILFSLVLITNSVSSLQIQTTASSDPITTAATGHCGGRWIYIRSLPSHFNLDLLSNCSEHPLFDNFCPCLANHGLGHKTHNKSQSWYRTDTLILELIFHRRILEYPCLTVDPNLANAVYLPYYAGYGPNVNSSMEHGVRLFESCSLMNRKYRNGIWGMIISGSWLGPPGISLSH